MSETRSIEFVLHGKVEGQEITPRTIGLSQFNEFNQQVETFIGGSQKVKLDQVHVEIAQSSYVFRAMLPAVVLSSLEPDLKLMERQDVLGEMDIKRAEVVQRWQARAKTNPDLSYEVRPDGATPLKVRVSRETDYRVGEIVPWVAVEKYLFGQIVDMGGMQKANVHLKIERGGKMLLVGASQGYLQEQVENRLYHKALLHVRAEQHFRTGELRNIQLISFVDYQPVYSEEALDRFTTKGAEAWADVADAAQWVREMRGG
ncbi:MAG: hypothetical protein ABSG59_07375 [Verrucomicrobiota bacterium]|jgi:hypothetical protein